MKSLIASLSFLISLSVFAADGTKTLVCRGGAPNQMKLMTRLLPAPLSASEFYFTKANWAAGKKGESLKPGQCAFDDRPLSAEEPAIVLDHESAARLIATTENGVQKISVKDPYSFLLEGKAQDRYLIVEVTGAGEASLFLRRKAGTELITFQKAPDSLQ